MNVPKDESSHPADPLLKFVLAMSEAGLHQAVLDSGFLDVLVCIYAANFVGDEENNLIVWPVYEDGEVRLSSLVLRRNTLLATGRDLLLSISRTREAQLIVAAHPICVLWPKDDHLIAIYGARANERGMTWRKLGNGLVLRRVFALDVLCCFKDGRCSYEELADASDDALEFSK